MESPFRSEAAAFRLVLFSLGSFALIVVAAAIDAVARFLVVPRPRRQSPSGCSSAGAGPRPSACTSSGSAPRASGAYSSSRTRPSAGEELAERSEARAQPAGRASWSSAPRSTRGSTLGLGRGPGPRRGAGAAPRQLATPRLGRASRRAARSATPIRSSAWRTRCGRSARRDRHLDAPARPLALARAGDRRRRPRALRRAGHARGRRSRARSRSRRADACPARARQPRAYEPAATRRTWRPPRSAPRRASP